MKQFVCLGYHVDKEKGIVTGLAMMHDLFISILREKGYVVKAISLNDKRGSSSTKIASSGVLRLLDYFPIIGKLLYYFLFGKNVVLYFNPSTAKAGFYRDVVAVHLAKLFGHKVLMQQFGALFESFKSSLTPREQKILVRTYNKADMIIVEGENARKQYPFLSDINKIKVIQNGLPDTNKNIPKYPKEYKQGQSFNMFFLNNMIESKGYMDVIKAVDILVNHRKRDVTCVFAGRFMQVQGDEYFKSTEEAKQWFDGYVADRGLTERVKYYESVFDDNKVREFTKAHVYLLPSYYIYEGQPTAVLEALSYGCVPVVTRYRLIPDMVNEQCGIFVEPKSPESIADAIESLIDNPEQYVQMSNNAYERFNASFTQEAYANKILKTIETL